MKERSKKKRDLGKDGRIIKAVALFSTLMCLNAWAAARFEERIDFEQPDGTVIELRGEGNEYRVVYEPLHRYTVVFGPGSKVYFYAVLSETGHELVSSGLQVGQGAPESF